MGISVSGKLLVGAKYGDIGKWLEEKAELEDCEVYDIIDGHFHYATPYYDADLEDWFIGFPVSNKVRADESWWLAVKDKSAEFEKLTGTPASIYGGQHVS